MTNPQYKIVPIEPTDEMQDEMHDSLEIEHDYDPDFGGISTANCSDIYKAAINAAPLNNLVAVDKGELEALLGILQEAPELNMLNYNDDDVEQLNDAMIDAFRVVTKMVSALTPFGGDNDKP